MTTTQFPTDHYSRAAQEDRCAPRTRIQIPCSLRASGGRSFQTIVHDLSLGGFCCAAINRLHVGGVVWLTIPGLEALRADVVWWDKSLAGCAFDSLLSPIVHDNLLARFRGDSVYRSM